MEFHSHERARILNITNTPGIYQIENILNAKKYIGSSVNVKRRMRTHRRLLENGNHFNHKLQDDWSKHGEKAFKFSLIIICSNSSKLMYEKICIDVFESVDTGYNISSNPRAPVEGLTWKQSQETKDKIRKARTGTKRSAEVCRNISIGRKGKGVGRIMTQETREKISLALKGRPQHPSNDWTGRHHSEESKRKIGDASRGRVASEESRKKMSAAKLGRIVSAETRRKLSVLNKGRVHSSAIRQNMSDAHKGKPWSTARRAAHEAKKVN